jgi:hypothetical protein
MQRIRIDDQGVRRELEGGKVEQVGWDDLQEVVVLTPRAPPCSSGFSACRGSTTRPSSGR